MRENPDVHTLAPSLRAWEKALLPLSLRTLYIMHQCGGSREGIIPRKGENMKAKSILLLLCALLLTGCFGLRARMPATRTATASASPVLTNTPIDEVADIKFKKGAIDLAVYPLEAFHAAGSSQIEVVVNYVCTAWASHGFFASAKPTQTQGPRGSLHAADSSIVNRHS